MSTSSRIVIIGAGPIGLEAALLGRERGYEVIVLERMHVAASLRSWGHVRLFSPFGLNSSGRGRAAVADSGIPGPDAAQTGHEFFESYLQPLSRHPLLAGCIRESCEVLAIGRSTLWKGDLIGKTERQRSKFQILYQHRNPGNEQTIESDFVFDCSGTWPNHNWLGAGGIPCPGERSRSDTICYRLPDVLGRDRDTYAGQRVLVIGSGFSAATSLVALAKIKEEAPATHVTWLTRTDRNPPMTVIENDPLVERGRLTREANALAIDSSTVSWRRNAVVRRVERQSDGSLQVQCEDASSGAGQSLVVDRIIACVGYRPDRSLYEELHVHECYATQGPIKLAAALLGETSSDCMAQSSPGADTLRNPEPGFFILGSKSYGRDSRFLLRIGIEQVEAVYDLIAGEPS